MKTNRVKIFYMSFFLLILSFVSCNKNTQDTKSDDINQKPVGEKIYKIGISQIVDHPALNETKKGFIKAIEESGLKVEYDEKIPDKDLGAQNLIMQQFVNEKKDLIFAIATPTAQSAINQTSEIPVVFASVTDPEGANLTGRANVTGTSGRPAIEKNIKLIKLLFPHVKKIGVLYNTSEQNSVFIMNELKKVTEAENIEIVEAGVTNGSEVMQNLERLNQIDVFYAVEDNTLVTYFETVVEKMNEKKIPIVASNNVFVEKGALISEGVSDYDIGYQAGKMAIEILKNGKKPSEIEIIGVSDVYRTINLKVAELLGIKLPDEIINDSEKIQ